MIKYLFLISIMVVLAGCADDPWRNALAAQHNAIAANSQAQTTAQIDQAQSTDADRRNAQARLEALQLQQSIVQGQAVIAHADAQAKIAISDNEALIAVADKMIEATRPNYNPLYAAMTAITIVIIAWLIVNGRRPIQPTAEAQSAPPAPQSPRVIFQSTYASAWQQPDGTVILRRLADGCERIYTPADPFYSKLIGGEK